MTMADQESTLAPDWLWNYVLQREGSGPESVSPAGAVGQAQILPSTAAQYVPGITAEDLKANPDEDLALGRRYLNELYAKYNNPLLAAAAYNAGPGRVDEYLAGKEPLPLETRKYIGPLESGGMAPGSAPGGYMPESNPFDLAKIRADSLASTGGQAPAPTYNINMPSPDAGLAQQLDAWSRMQRMSALMQFLQQGTHKVEPVDYDPWKIAQKGRIDTSNMNPTAILDSPTVMANPYG